ncbi:hypothetical protein JN853_20410 [Pseudomonas syringae pv. actinidiae ICMP 9853]|nr:hypothetical protein JN853_20410 [Pseudomonas syringae pv. actinidiae ICMP 9853]
MSAQDIVLSPEESAELSRRTRSATISQRDGRRARVILLAAQGCSRVEIARLVGFSLRSVTLWCKRFQEQGLDGLIDKPGRGRKSFLPPDAMARVLEKVVQPRIGQPRWSCRSMAQVAGISPASVQRIGVFQGSCRVNRLTMLLFSQRFALDPGLTARCRSVPSCVSPSTTALAFSLWLARTAHVAWPGSDGPALDAAQSVSRNVSGCADDHCCTNA